MDFKEIYGFCLACHERVLITELPRTSLFRKYAARCHGSTSTYEMDGPSYAAAFQHRDIGNYHDSSGFARWASGLFPKDNNPELKLLLKYNREGFR